MQGKNIPNSQAEGLQMFISVVKIKINLYTGPKTSGLDSESIEQQKPKAY